MSNTLKYLLVGVLVALLGIVFVPSIRADFNLYRNEMKRTDDRTTYEARKRVEDEARSLVASYNNDKLRYEQYKASTDKTHLEWAEQAKMRANQAATTFNEFVLKNSYVFEGNIPADINFQLPILE